MGLRQRIQHVFTHLSERTDTGTGRRGEPPFTPVSPNYAPPEKSDCETVSSFSATIRTRRQTWDPPPDYDVLPSTEDSATASVSQGPGPGRDLLLTAPSVTSVSPVNVSVRFVGEYSSKYIRQYLNSISSRLLPQDTPASKVRAAKPVLYFD